MIDPQTADLAPRILQFVQDRQRAMLDLLQELVIIQSGSQNKPGLDKMAARMARAMPRSLHLQHLTHTLQGNMLIARSSGVNRTAKQLLLLGHMDTVFPQHTDFNFFREDEHYAYGPGVIDMKGGLVCSIYALLALEHFGLLSELPVSMVCNSDEEIGSPASWDLICQEADKSFAALVMECGGLQGQIVTGRKGRSGFRLLVQGHSGHAAQAGTDKSSAILELAHKIIALEDLNAPPALSVNVGSIQGGIGPNTVPGHAEAAIDIRYLQQKDLDAVQSQLQEIMHSTRVEGTSCTLSYQSGRPPMPQDPGNQGLFQQVQDLADLLDFAVQPELRNGVSDANIVASRAVPVLDGLGPAGALDHSEHEYLQKSSLIPRCVLLALSIWHLCRQKLP